jgi:hypothetical protein
MVASGLHDVGEEWSQKFNFRQDLISRDTSLEVLLFDDSTDSLTDSSDIADVTTEPTDGNYTRQTVTLDSSAVTLNVVEGDIRAKFELTFDVENTTGTVDAYGLVNDFQSDIVNAESAANPHLITSASFAGGSRDLSNFKEIDLSVRLDLT